MISILSLITSIKDYLEVVHKFIEYDSVNINYTELGSILTFFLISIKNCMLDFFSFSWLLKENFWSLPIIIPEISSAMISEISVLDGYFHNAFNFLDTPVSYGMPVQNGFISCLEKLTIGLINSFFLFLPTSTAHIITLRRFIMQGLNAGYISGLGTIAGNLFWLASVILGCRFFVIPWLSLDIFRYVLGFILLVKYMWDSYNERKMVPTLAQSGTNEPNSSSFSSQRGSMAFTSQISMKEGSSLAGRGGGSIKALGFFEPTKIKIFLLNFLLALTEQTSIYPFISNISINPEISILETFPLGTAKIATDSLSAPISLLEVGNQLNVDSSNGTLFICIHLAYLLGIGLGSISLLHLSCWFWENPAFKLYMWVISSFKISTSFYYKLLNFGFLYLTMLSAICSIPYYGLDYTITNPLGYVNDDRIIQDKVVLETSFLGTKASDRNTRRNRGRHGRRERWKRRIRKYRTFDASLYDQGIYDLFTIEDLNYGFDRFWLRRKLRNHRVRFRFFPGPWMRSFKKQLAKPRLESYTGPRIEFFRILFEQVHHPSFHAYTNNSNSNKNLVSALARSNSVPISNPEDKNTTESLTKLKGSHSLNYSLYSLPLPITVAKEQENQTLFSRSVLSNKKELGVNKLGSEFPLDKLSSSQLVLKGEHSSISSSFSESKTIPFKEPQTKKSTLRKFIRKFDNRVKIFKPNLSNMESSTQIIENKNPIYSKQWKNFAFLPFTLQEGNKEKEGFGVSSPTQGKGQRSLLNNLKGLPSFPSIKKEKKTVSTLDYLDEKKQVVMASSTLEEQTLKKQRQNLSKKDLQILHYRSLLTKVPMVPLVKTKVNKNQQNKIGESLMLLHPLKFYLQKEAGFKRKLRYYTPSIYRKFSVENNAPYFRVMMKRYFYNYKPSLRWERTMKTASLRKARRKTTRIPRKLQNTNRNTNLVVGAPNAALVNNTQIANQFPESNQYLPIQLEKNSQQKSTYNYSVVSKRANRYRYQIYKDVLQHWYYSPFNRLLLKLDVDSFIRRQPNAHFLTSKEENLLHLRRFLLSEHYNTLRWYTNMEHYRSMKTQLNGGTKSFASRSYNQQFSGTFKKIRHLFAITPSVAGGQFQDENPGQVLQPNVLKFDQPLYNEYANNSSNPLLNPLIIHEELLPDLAIPLKTNEPFISSSLKGDIGFLHQGDKEQNNYQSERVGMLNGGIMQGKKENSNDLLSQSQNIIREYLIQTRSVREDYIKKLLSENNYAELTKFIYKGQKIRGDEPVTNQKILNNQEKKYLLTLIENNKIAATLLEGEKQSTSWLGSVNSNSSLEEKNIENNRKENFYLTYLKKWKRHVNDQESLKNYLTRRLDKREKRKQKKEKQLLTKLQRLENWFSLNNVSNSNALILLEEKQLTPEQDKTCLADNSNDLLTSGLQKSILEGMFALKNSDRKGIPVANNDCSLPFISMDKESTDGLLLSIYINGKGNQVNEKNLWKVLLLSKIKEKQTISNTASTVLSNSPYSFIRLQDLTLRFNDIKYAQNLKLSNNLKTSIQATRKFIQTNSKNSKKYGSVLNGDGDRFVKAIEGEDSQQISKRKMQLYNSFKNKVSTFRNICFGYAKTAQNNIFKIQNLVGGFSSPLWSSSLSSGFVKEGESRQGSKLSKQKSLKDWRKKERVLNKQKRLRKEFKLLNKKTESISTYLDRNELELALQVPSRKKRESFSTNNVGSSGGGLEKEQQKNNYTEKEQINLPVTFKRKRSPQRRSRVRRNRGVFKKRTLSDSLRKDFLLFYNDKIASSINGDDYQAPFLRQGDKEQSDSILKSKYYQKFNENLYGKPNSNLNVGTDPSGKLYTALPLPEKLGLSGETLQLGKNETSLKQRKSKQRKERYWKQKRSKYAQKRRKYRKRRRYTIVKIRSLNKQFKRIKNQIEIQNWWWKQFIPSIQASNEALWQIEKDKLIQQKLSQLSTSEILERDSLNSSNFNILQIGNKDFKPLALPYAIRLNKITSSVTASSSQDTLLGNEGITQEAKSSYLKEPLVPFNSALIPFPLKEEKEGDINQKFQVVNKLYESLFINNKNSSSAMSRTTEFLVPNTNLPFYAGWDESLRKLIVTNRMLSRKEAGFSFSRSSQFNNLATSPNSMAILSKEGYQEDSPLNNKARVIDPLTIGVTSPIVREEFTLAPLQGMNAATTLYWQIPFTTYDPDQFFALGMDGFSPIGWRKFLFRHSILKTWLVNKEVINLNNSKMDSSFTPSYSLQEEGSITAFSKNSSLQNESLKKGASVPVQQRENGTTKISTDKGTKQVALIVKTRSNILKDFSLLSQNTEQSKTKNLNQQEIWNSMASPDKQGIIPTTNEYQQKKNAFAVSRRLKKRYRRVKKHPRTPVWFPSGPLLNQVLPVHYIYVFYKRARLPRDRYLKRRLINVKDLNSRSPGQNSQQQAVPNLLNYDFTLRKRLKPKRKYHLKRDYYASNVVIPRRFKFMSSYLVDSNPSAPYSRSEVKSVTKGNKWRPLSTLKIHKPISEVVKEQQLLRRSAQQKQKSSKQQPSMRVKQLRRRVQRQILRSVWRYRPRAGGFVWSGDYLKLELVKAPKLQQSSILPSPMKGKGVFKGGEGQNVLEEGITENLQTNLTNDTIKKQKRKKKRTLVEWQIQPKIYLYEKHNIKVLKKKLLKSQRSFGSNTTTLNVLRNSI